MNWTVTIDAPEADVESTVVTPESPWRALTTGSVTCSDVNECLFANGNCDALTTCVVAGMSSCRITSRGNVPRMRPTMSTNAPFADAGAGLNPFR